MNDRRMDALKRLGDAPLPVEEPSASRRERIVGRMQSVIRAEAARKESRTRRARVFAGLALAAGVALAIGAAWRAGRSHPAPPVVAQRAPSVARVAAASGAVVVTRAGRADAVPPAADVPMDPSDELTTALGGEARLVFGMGVSFELLASTRVTVRAPERVAVSAGEVRVRGTSDAFRVDTPNAELTVIGASVVTVRDGATRVSVSDGVVTVKQGDASTTLHAGDTWPAPPAPTAAPAPPPSHVALKPRPDPSTLDEQNRLLQRALAARRQGDDARAIGDLDQLLARYPGSPLAQEARVEKFRALERMGNHAKAVVEARRYLADYPNGFAASEAQSLVLR